MLGKISAENINISFFYVYLETQEGLKFHVVTLEMSNPIFWDKYEKYYNCWLIVLAFNDTSTLVGHFWSSPRERKKIDIRDKRDQREGQGRKRKMNESEETEEIKTLPLYPYVLQG